jgi:hypothetical protein
MGKSAKHAHLNDVHNMWLSRHGQWLLSLFGNSSQKFDKTPEQKTYPYVPTTHGPQLACLFHWFAKTLIKPTNNKSMGAHEWLGHRVSFFLCVFSIGKGFTS